MSRTPYATSLKISGELPVRRWTREEFYRLYNMGFFDPEERYELIAGEIYEKMTQNRPHALAVIQTDTAIEAAFGAGFHTQQQMPVALSTDGAPEPDIAVLRGRPTDYTDHPTENDTVLIVEVSDSTLAFDQGRKAAQYAQAGIADYWIVNLVDRTLEVRRNPVAVPDTRFGFAYSDVRPYSEGEAVAPLAAPNSPVAVADLLPPVAPTP